MPLFQDSGSQGAGSQDAGSHADEEESGTGERASWDAPQPREETSSLRPLTQRQTHLPITPYRSSFDFDSPKRSQDPGKTQQ
ncbi:hypothetical protein SAMD00023353_1900410 [Rosellinia necatrix]|uniref:Uncharacterized protein n=1 Tax=Rosellinia necatrix TaxID=77044 RepID=A0A1S8A7K2_ROSNE|nr:hypothetical protein SAMD00023353_1900410 [Rosellinia necatrix]